MNLLITGGAGFIGSHIAEFYAQDLDNSVYIIDNLSRNDYNWKYLKRFENIEFTLADLRQYNFLKGFLKSNEIDVVIHCAGQTAVTTSMVKPKEDFGCNVVGTFNLLESIRQSNNNPLIIFCSTNKVYGENVNKLALEESTLRYELKHIKGISSLMPIDHTKHTPYGTSKLCADLYVQEYGKTYDLKTMVARMSCIYGTRQFGIEDQGWVAHFILSALSNKVITIYGDGKQVRDILYVSDLIHAFDSFIKKAKNIESDVFNIGGGPTNIISLLELIHLLEELLNKKITMIFKDWRPSDQKVYVSSITKAKEILEWEPSVEIKIGIKKVIEWAKANLKLQ